MKLTCNEVLDLMVDYIDENLNTIKTKAVKDHLEHCTPCLLEYNETKSLISSVNSKKISKEYFSKQKSSIIKKIENYEDNICQETQDTILLLDKLNPQMEKHLKTCTKCTNLQKEIASIENLLSGIVVEVPKQQFFKTQLSRITWRLSYDEKSTRLSIKEILKSIQNTFEYFIRPTSVLALSGALVLLLVFNVFIIDQTPNSKKIIYLSELLNKTQIKSQTNNIPGINYGKQLNIEATGTARIRLNKEARTRRENWLRKQNI